MRAIVTGAGGFVGPYLTDMLLANDVEVIALGDVCQNTSHPVPIPVSVPFLNVDVCDFKSVNHILADWNPDYLFHLAGITNVPQSVQSPLRTFEVNVGGTLNILESVRLSSPRTQVAIISSAHVYGSLDSGVNGFCESDPLHPQSPYATSKVCCEMIAQEYTRSYGLAIFVFRAFNHVGPGQSPIFVCSDLARQIASMHTFEEHTLRIGNPNVERDFSDVRDIVAGYWHILQHGTPGEIYNLASGSPASISTVIELLANAAGVDLTIETDHSKLRSNEVMRLCGNPGKARALGWQPRYTLCETLEDLLKYWQDQQYSVQRPSSN